MDRMVKKVQRAGLLLAEAGLAVALFSLCGVSLLGALTQGAATAARAGEMEMASVVAGRAVDRMLADGHDTLATLAGESGEVGFAGPDGQLDSLACDGVDFNAQFQVDRLRPGLLALRIQVAWRRPGTIGAKEAGTFSVVRYVADPARSLDVR